MKKAIFKELTFKNKDEFDSWLNATTFKKITLKDLGQDMLNIWVHESGEILNCDFHWRVFTGKFIDMNKLKVGDNLRIWDEDEGGFVWYSGLIVKKLSRPSSNKGRDKKMTSGVLQERIG